MSKLVLKKKRLKRRGRRAKSTGFASLSTVDAFFARFSKFSRFPTSWLASIPLAVLIVGAFSLAASAQDEPLSAESVQAVLDNIWVLVAAVLVIFMNAGFGMLETGFCRQKNAVNILSKNLIVFALATLAFWAIGFSFMFNPGNAFIGGGGWFLTGDAAAYGLDGGTLTIPVFFLFQAAFAGTAATIVSGAVAERVHFVSFILFSLLLTGISYPITGHWVWSGTGWLGAAGFSDFAGSTVVHSVGGWAALVGAVLLGPRIGKYQNGQPNALPGHSLSLAMLGCLILWIGWFGFNPGSQLAADSAVPFIAVTTNLAAAAGAVAATVTSWVTSGKPDLSMIINGILAGLVGITAGCAGVNYLGAVIIGLIAGIIVVFSVFFFDSIKVDDPVGAISVHLVCGVWGTLAVGLFDVESGLFFGGGFTQLGAQILGIIAIGAFTVILSAIFWSILKATVGIRVSEEDELMGLDVAEHGMEAYSGFVKDASGAAGSTSNVPGGSGMASTP
ncbi:MAG: ammonium transporter [Elainellaceae cyanobacterium]